MLVELQTEMTVSENILEDNESLEVCNYLLFFLINCNLNNMTMSQICITCSMLIEKKPTHRSKFSPIFCTINPLLKGIAAQSNLSPTLNTVTGLRCLLSMALLDKPRHQIFLHFFPSDCCFPCIILLKKNFNTLHAP